MQTQDGTGRPAYFSNADIPAQRKHCHLRDVCCVGRLQKSLSRRVCGCCLIIWSVVWFRTSNQKHLSAVRGVTENNFQITETDESSGCRIRGGFFVHFHIFWGLTGHRISSTGKHSAANIRHQGQTRGSNGKHDGKLLVKGDLINAIQHFKSSTSSKSYCNALCPNKVKIKHNLEHFWNANVWLINQIADLPLKVCSNPFQK